MLPITQNLLTSTRNRPYLRDPAQYAIRQLKGVIAHWTANPDPGANAEANRNYFNITDRYASAHYVVDDHSIVQCIPDNEMAYHVGGAHYRPDGERIIADSGLTPNYFLIGVEMCVNSDGDWNKTYQHSVELYAHLLHKYKLTVYDLYRHYDITGKDCPKMMLTDTEWGALRRQVAKALGAYGPAPIAGGKVNSFELNVRTGPGAQFPVRDSLNHDTPVRIYETRNNWHRIGDRRWVNAGFISQEFQTRLAMVSDASGANIRSGPGMQHAIVDALPHGILLEVYETNGNWLSIGTHKWLHKSVLTIVQAEKGVVSGTDMLNVRSGPGTTNRIVRILHRADPVSILEKSGGWLRIGLNEWVFGGFIQVL